MPHIPRTICSEDLIEMTTSHNGVLVEMKADFGPYYKIYTDQVTCPVCRKSVLLPGKRVLVEHYEPTYDQCTADVVAEFK